MKKIPYIIALAAVVIYAYVAYAATTFTTNYSFSKPGDGDRNFGSLIRGNWDAVDTQVKSNETATTDHVSDVIAAHVASAISATSGTNSCTTQTDVQAYLTCLDGTLDPTVSGIVLILGAQTITGQKTFSANPIFSSSLNGILNTDGAGLVSAGTFASLAPLTTKGDVMAFDTAETRLAVGNDGQVLEADSTTGTGLAWANKNPRWQKVTHAFGAFSAASTTFAITSLTLAANEGLDAVIIKHTTAFSGGAISALTVKVGITSFTDTYSNNFDVFQATGNTVRRVNNVLDLPNFGATTSVLVTATSTGANLDQATAGSVDIYYRTFVLP